METYIKTLEQEFSKNRNVLIALEQKAYMRQQFDYFGIKSPERRIIQKPFLQKDYLPNKNVAFSIIKELWLKPERDFQYFAQELAFKYVNQLEVEDISTFEFMVLNKSWWDTIDMIANKLMGAYFKSFPEQRKFYVDKWLQSGNFWLQRCAILFQLKYKQDVDTELLAYVINKLLGSNEFFINKAIGWMLREYSRTNAEWVKDFIYKTDLQPLSRREALKLIK